MSVYYAPETAPKEDGSKLNNINATGFDFCRLCQVEIWKGGHAYSTYAVEGEGVSSNAYAYCLNCALLLFFCVQGEGGGQKLEIFCVRTKCMTPIPYNLKATVKILINVKFFK